MLGTGSRSGQGGGGGGDGCLDRISFSRGYSLSREMILSFRYLQNSDEQIARRQGITNSMYRNFLENEWR
jgi:hypothetical protein